LHQKADFSLSLSLVSFRLPRNTDDQMSSCVIFSCISSMWTFQSPGTF
jgi:hypothetical protein